MTTEERVVALKLENPNMRASEIHRIVGVERERVRQILVKNNLPTKVDTVKPTCEDCGTEVSYGSKRCRDCFLSKSWATSECAKCGNEIKYSVSHDKYRMKTGRYSGDRYCKRECFYDRNK